MTKNAATIALLTALNTNVGYDLNLNNAMRIVNAMQAHLTDDVQPVAVCTHDLDALREAAKGGVDTAATVAFIRANKEVMDLLNQGLFIQGIKVLRTAVNGGLKECKDAVDVVIREDNLRNNAF